MASDATCLSCLTRRRVALIVLTSLGLCYHVNLLSTTGDSYSSSPGGPLLPAHSPNDRGTHSPSPPSIQQHSMLHNALGNRTSNLSLPTCSSWMNGVGGPAVTAGAGSSATRMHYQPYLKTVVRRAFDEMQSNELLPDLKSFCSGEQPARVSVLLTTWRTGSTFIGDVLAKHPALAYHYEPMVELGLQQARDGELLQLAARSLQQLAHCNTTEKYIATSKSLGYGLTSNRFWNGICKKIHTNHNWCWNAQFQRDLCQLLPYRLIKLVRVRLHALKQMMDENDSVRVLVTGRDPRATKHSRRNPFFCRGRAECDDPGLCSDMVKDYHTALAYSKDYPGRVRLIRYEDIVEKPMDEFQNITSFFGLHFTEDMKMTVLKNINGTTKTVQRSKGRRIQAPSQTYSTVRDAHFEATQWREEMSWPAVQRIQDECHEAMQLWGYNMATSEGHLKTFDPVGLFEGSLN